MKANSPLFTTTREKRFWFWAFAVVAAIFSTLFMGNPLAEKLRDQNVQAVFFVIGMVLVAAAVIAHGLRRKPGRMELSMLLGIIAVYTMLIFRLGAPERSHLIEYGVLAVFIHKALIERARQKKLILKPALFALILSFSIGLADEAIQIILPYRVFDPLDIIFNGVAAALALGSSLLLYWVSKRVDSSKS